MVTSILDIDNDISIAIKNIKDDKKILETIKEYLNKNETNKLLESIKLNAKQQDNYIDYIITELP